MTDLISTPIDTDEGGEIGAGQLQHLPPQTLIIGDNVRTDAKIDADFLASIRQCRFRFPLANRHHGEFGIRHCSALLGEAVFPLFVANPRTVRLCSYSLPVRNWSRAVHFQAAEPDPLAAATEVTRPIYTVTGVNRAAPGTGVRRLVEKSVVVKSTTYGTGSPIVR